MLQGLADADDRLQPRAQGRPGFGGHDLVGLAVAGPPLGVADDHQPGARVGQHLGGDVAGEGSAGFGMAVLAADLHQRTGQGLGHPGHQGGGRTQGHPGARGPARQGVSHRPGLSQRGGKPVHLPIAGDQVAKYRCHGEAE